MTLSLLLLSLLVLLSPSVSLSSETFGERVVRIARGYTYVREHGYNRGAEIDRWNRTAGVPLSSSWCQAFVYSMYDSACKEISARNPLKRTGSVSIELRYANDIGSGLQVIPTGRLIGSAALPIQAGDILSAKRRGGTESDIGGVWPGHTEIAVSRYGGDRVRTIGGNTSAGRSGSQADGDGVHERTRSLTWFVAIIRAPL